MLTPIPSFVGPSAHGGPVDFVAQRTLNMYVEPASAPDASPAALVAAPGYRLARAFGDSVTAMHVIDRPDTNAESLVVAASGGAGGFVYVIDGEPIGGALARLSTYVGPAGNSIAWSGVHLAVARGVGGPSADGITFYDSTLNTASLVGNGLYAARSIVFLDSRFYFIDAITNRVYCTGAYATTIDPLHFKTPEASPDKPRKLVVVGGELWVFGDRSVEVWGNTGADGFPLESNKSATMSGGCAPNTVQLAAGVPYWVAFDQSGGPHVVRANGYQIQRISTPEVESRLAAAITTNSVRPGADWRAWAYTREGHTFYTVSCFFGDFSVCYDALTSMWFDRASAEAGDWSKLHQERVNLHAYFGGQNVVTMLFVHPFNPLAPTTADPGFYVMGGSLVDGTSGGLPKRRTTQHFRTPMRSRHNEFALDVMTGLGQSFEAGTSETNPPRVSLKWSDDGGRTFSNEHWRSLGHAGEYAKRVSWRRLGSSRDRVYEIAITDQVPVAIMGASLDMEAVS